MNAVTLSGTPIASSGVVQPAPAARPSASQLQAGPLVARPPMAALAGTDAGATAGEGARLVVPEAFRTQLQAAVQEGRADARTFAREHPSRGERSLVTDWALLRMKWPPKTDAEDLAFLHDVARGRTSEGIARAQYLAKHGLTDEWERMLEDYTRAASPRDAKRAKKLLHDALMLVNTITQTAKAGAARQRPFVVDPTLELAVDRPGNNPSYPSGHTTAAFAASMVLAHLMPDRRDEFMGNAFEASWSRLYGGVHFPTDVLAGAKLATTVTAHLIRTADTTPRIGTRPNGGDRNPGVAGSR